MTALVADTFPRDEMSKSTLLKTSIGREDLDVLDIASKNYRLTNERCFLVIKWSPTRHASKTGKNLQSGSEFKKEL